jgi:arabinofuranan 3-O-arabinosyltransferase
MALAPEEQANLSRTLTVPQAVSVIPVVWVRPRQGPNLADLIADPAAARARGESDVLDVSGSAFAAADGDPRTAWTAPQRVVQHKTPPTLTLTLPRPTEVGGLRLTPSGSALPAHPTKVSVDLGDGPQVRELPSGGDGAAHDVALRPRITGSVTLRLLDWTDVIDRTALGFDQLKPPGLAEVAVLGGDGRPIGAADAARNLERQVVVDCSRGPIVAVAGRFVHTSIHSTVRALLRGEPVPAQPCEADPIVLPAGQQELLISPGDAFVVDGAQLSVPNADVAGATTVPATAGAWGAARREVRVPPAGTSRVLVVPESSNPGWVARAGDGSRLTPVSVNGWQQGWVVPAGSTGTITLTFAYNSLYRIGLAGGLALLPLLALMAALPRRRPPGVDLPAQPWTGGLWAAGAALGVGAVISGVVGVVVFGAGLGMGYALRHHRRWCDAATLALSAGGLILAGAALSRHPWRSVDGYAGHAASVQLLALVSLAAVTAAVVSPARRSRQVSGGTGSEN